MQRVLLIVVLLVVTTLLALQTAPHNLLRKKLHRSLTTNRPLQPRLNLTVASLLLIALHLPSLKAFGTYPVAFLPGFNQAPGGQRSSWA